MRKILIVAKQELKRNVKRKSFIAGVIGFPLILAISIFLPVLFVQNFVMPHQYTVGVVDYASILDRDVIFVENKKNPFAESSGMIVFKIYKNVEVAKKSFARNEIQAYYIIPENFNKTFTIEKETKGLFDADSKLELVIAKKFGDTAYRFAKGIKFKRVGKEEKPLDFVVSMFIPLLLFMAIFASSGYLMQGIIEEKESRIMEILLSSASPEEVFMGKFIGNALAGLIQVSVWLGLAGFLSAFMLSLKLINLKMVIVAGVFFILGYLLYSSILSAIGSVSSSLRDAQQATSVVVFLILFPAFFLIQMASLNPESSVLKALSFFPLTSPALIPSLYSSGSISFIDLSIGAIILALTSILTLKISAKIFRYYALSYSKLKMIEISKFIFRINP